MRQRVVLLYGKHEASDNPLALHCLATFCNRNSALAPSVEFQVVTFEHDDEACTTVEAIDELQPSMVAASCYVWNVEATLRICSALKLRNPRLPIVLGGPEVGHTPGDVLQECSAIDVIVSGEGEETFSQVISTHLAGRDFDAIPGTTVRSRRAVVTAPRRPSLDLTRCPLVYAENSGSYMSSLKGKALYETLRGCSHLCFFCDCGAVSRGRVRFFPVDRIRQELDFILQQDSIRHLYLTDSEINIDDDHAKQVLRILNDTKRRYRWDGAITFHLDLSKKIDDEMADLLCEATAGIGIGVQTFNEAALYQMGRRWFNRRIFQENVDRLENDIRFVFQFIYSCPGDTYETFSQSVRWAALSNRDVWFDRLRVLPGTVYRARPERFELEFERSRPNYVISTNTFSRSDMQRAEDLKRGFLLYTFRERLRLECLRDYLGLGMLQLLECFGSWCRRFVPDASLSFARADPVGLPRGFLHTLTTWIGEWILSRRAVGWSEYEKLREVIPWAALADTSASNPRSVFASTRGN